MLSLIGPISTTSVPSGAMKRASEVPPPVNCSACRPVVSPIAACAASISFPRRGEEGFAGVPPVRFIAGQMAVEDGLHARFQAFRCGLGAVAEIEDHLGFAGD